VPLLPARADAMCNGSDLKDLEDGKLREWEEPYERLAAILLADQFTR
jgi:hypothetical protein